jgi:phage shock protein PspC (stress-responsive transcriptional regulator)
MKKSLKISLGGIAFTIEEDAYAALELYLQSLKGHFGDTEEAREVTRDIEERAAELLVKLLAGKEIVTIEMVNDVIDTLGRPEQISDEEIGGENEPSDASKERSAKHRLYRDPQNALVAGVSAGLGAYFNVDPLVFRILFAILVLANGLGAVIYIILWIVLPQAETVRQRMEMRGEEMNLSNIEKNIKYEFEQVRNNMKRNRFADVMERFVNALGRFFVALGGVLAVVAKVVVAIIAVFFIGIGLLGITGSVLSLFLGDTVIALLPNYSGLTIGQLLGTTFDLGSMLWIIIPVFLIVLIPFLSLIFIGLRMVFRFNVRGSAIFVTSASVWIFAVLLLASVTFLQARSFTIRESVKDRFEISLADTTANTLWLVGDEDFDYGDYKPEKIVTIDDYSIAQNGGYAKIIGKPKVYIAKSDGDNFEMLIVKKSRGATRQTARHSADAINLEYTLVGDKLVLSPYFYIPYNQKWRVQEVEVTIFVPEGKRIHLEENLENILSSDQEYCSCWPDEMVGNIWQMSGNRLIKQ